jgi:3-oxoacyl-(acyl-carrier-protein) synthase
MNDRVAITAWGALTPWGNDARSFVSGLMEGRRARLPLPGPLNRAVDLPAGQVLLPRAELLRMPHCKGLRPGTMTRLTFLSSGALARCMEAAGVSEADDGAASDRGLFVGSYTNIAEIDKYARLALAAANREAAAKGRFELDPARIPEAMRRFSGFEFLKLLNNMPTAHGAIQARCQGPCQTFLGHPLAALLAIGRAWRTLQWGEASSMYAGGVGSSVMQMMLLLRNSRGWFDLGVPPGEGAAYVLLEREGDGRATARRALAHPRGFASAWVGAGDSWSAERALGVAEEALREAGWAAERLDGIATLGMGLPENDRRERDVLDELCGANGVPRMSLTEPLGWMEAGHGAVLVAACVAALERRRWPSREGRAERALVFGLEPNGHVAALALEAAEPGGSGPPTEAGDG